MPCRPTPDRDNLSGASFAAAAEGIKLGASEPADLQLFAIWRTGAEAVWASLCAADGCGESTGGYRCDENPSSPATDGYDSSQPYDPQPPEIAAAMRR